MVSGILVVNKEAGMTSHQVVNKVRKLTGIRKIGHAGTLDPEVTGVLPLCLGQATRLIEFIQEQPKRYRAQATFGYSTTTQDATGEIVTKGTVQHLTMELVQEALSQLQGTILQTPPAYSALKVNGKRAYELARSGETVTLQARTVTIYEIRLLSFEKGEDLANVEFDVTCSKGTYVRTLCHDLGVMLNCPAHMSKLVRTQSGPYTLQDAMTLAEIEMTIRERSLACMLNPPISALPHLPAWRVDMTLAKRIRSGQSISLSPLGLQAYWNPGTKIKVITDEQELLAIYHVSRNTTGRDVAKPVKVFL
jgi:tRNA pseudouridine55 synthase